VSQFEAEQSVQSGIRKPQTAEQQLIQQLKLHDKQLQSGEKILKKVSLICLKISMSYQMIKDLQKNH